MTPFTSTKNQADIEKYRLFYFNPEYAKNCLNNNKKFSSKGEREIRKILKERYGSKEVSSHRIVEYNNLKKSVDLTLKNKNILIEYDGIWHFDPTIYERFRSPKKYFEVISHCLLKV